MGRDKLVPPLVAAPTAIVGQAERLPYNIGMRRVALASVFVANHTIDAIKEMHLL